MKLKIKQLKNGIPIDEAEFFKWVEALDSGKYKQAQNYLQTEQGFCCLGVACDVLLPEDKKAYNKEGLNRVGMLFGTTTDHQKYAPRWLNHISSDVSERTQDHSLIHLNDNQQADFKQIAGILRAVYVYDSKLVYWRYRYSKAFDIASYILMGIIWLGMMGAMTFISWNMGMPW